MKVKEQKKQLVVEIHKLAHWKDDKILEKLCGKMKN